MSEVISNIQKEFERICNAEESVTKFLFDDVSGIGEYVKTDYPLILLKLPERSTTTDYNKFWEVWDFVVFAMKPIYQNDEDTLANKWDLLKSIIEDVLDEFTFDKQSYQIIGEVVFEYGHHEFIQDLAVVQSTFKVRLPNCRTVNPTGQTVTIIDNDSALVGTVSAKSILQVIAKDENQNVLDPTYTLASNVLTLGGLPVIGVIDGLTINDNSTYGVLETMTI